VEHRIRSVTAEEIHLVDRALSENNSLLEKYTDRLLWWNKKINLVSRDVSRETVREHVRHSLFICVSRVFAKHNKVIDTGSGGGLPGIPLSICFPDKYFLLNDIVSKKIFAVNDMINGLNLTGRAEGKIGDIEQLAMSQEALLITKHAFKADQLVEKIREKEWGSVVFLKGYKEAQREIDSIPGGVDAEIIILEDSELGDFYEGKSGVTRTKRS